MKDEIQSTIVYVSMYNNKNKSISDKLHLSRYFINIIHFPNGKLSIKIPITPKSNLNVNTLKSFDSNKSERLHTLAVITTVTVHFATALNKYTLYSYSLRHIYFIYLLWYWRAAL